jgi:ABC-type Mn2+/Zn2+ transport system permease subunit
MPCASQLCYAAFLCHWLKNKCQSSVIQLVLLVILGLTLVIHSKDKGLRFSGKFIHELLGKTLWIVDKKMCGFNS